MTGLAHDGTTRLIYYAAAVLEIGGVLLLIVDIWLDRRRARKYLSPLTTRPHPVEHGHLWRLHDTAGDDLGLREHFAPNLEPGRHDRL